MTRKRYALGNWKMHKTIQDTEAYVQTLAALLEGEPLGCTIGIAPPFTSLYSCDKVINATGASVWLGAQNVYPETAGAFTGEISLLMLGEVGVKFVLVGHSERRHIFGESDSFIASKVKAVAQAGLVPVLCIGESLTVREQGKTCELIETQLLSGLKEIPNNVDFLIAYEPIWAIGTGQVAKASDVQRIHLFCREVLAKRFSKIVAETVPILYGGSVKADNAQDLGQCDDVDGLLVGGASLEAQNFFDVARNFCW
ncbi:Bifunctional PGK/TIM,triosephosphate isomerase,triose-phosphate isomerase,Triosephosphate isomerase [Chlamydia serpentis]|uniref:Triosephosphate isomerase n=1 Tax=Chlamydia serpentis TaxID=1967782 RepID=A0A2R8FD29_9CHLA|nr:triose-phosphate isomerase [Chlamydia serpentis]SPN74167.1 Bifunctional PGK/TIM,triosephosphate isomerase,triose-phosphate isomerase,Triosephosphate isomerase [Chlamydia serpentis]